jgi:hypothetical protein
MMIIAQGRPEISQNQLEVSENPLEAGAMLRDDK